MLCGLLYLILFNSVITETAYLAVWSNLTSFDMWDCINISVICATDLVELCNLSSFDLWNNNDYDFGDGCASVLLCVKANCSTSLW